MDEEYERMRIDMAHAYLERIRKMGEDCAGLRAQIDDAYYRAEGVGSVDYAAVRVAKSPTADRMPDAVAAIQERIRAYVTDLAAYEDERHEAHRALMLMDDATEARALRLRYLCCNDWESVCVDMHYSYDGMMKLRRRALYSFSFVMPGRMPEPSAV